MTVTFQLVVDCTDPGPLAAFWAVALGYEPAPPPAGSASWDDWYRSVGVPEEELGLGVDRLVDPTGAGPALWFQVVPEGKSVKNRLHLDVQVGGGRTAPFTERRDRVEAYVARLAALGATRVRTSSDEAAGHHAVAMLDPEGNEFDVV